MDALSAISNIKKPRKTGNQSSIMEGKKGRMKQYKQSLMLR